LRALPAAALLLERRIFVANAQAEQKKTHQLAAHWNLNM
jgi:hypothetical protein